MNEAIPDSGTAEGGTSGRRAVALGVAVGLLAVVTGLLPHLVDGARLPAQELWRADAVTGPMPHAPMPLGYPTIVAMAVMIVEGGALAGIALGALRALRRPASVRAAVLTVAASQLAAVLASAGILAAHLRDDDMATLYVAALVVGQLVMVAIAIAACAWLASLGTARLALGAVVALVPAAWWWLDLSFTDHGRAGVYDIVRPLTEERPWAVALGLALGAAAAWSARAIAPAITGLLALWAVPAAMTAVSYALGSWMYIRSPADAAEAGTQVFREALTMGAATERVIACLIAGAVAAASVGWWRRRARPRTS